MKKIILGIFMIHFWIMGYAQELPKVIPLSPEVSNLARYAETPVSYNTGVPNISIPIYSLKEGNISIPVSLSYHAGGHKVEEIASNVGLGWSLIGGGQIYRIVKQLPDDIGNSGYLHTDNTIASYKAMNNTFRGRLIRGALEYESVDLAPDEFHYNFMGYTGKFMFNQNRTKENPYGEIIQFPKSDIKIEASFNAFGNIDEYILTTPDGISYYFGEHDYTDSVTSSESFSMSGSSLPSASPNNNDRAYNTSWKLTKIVSYTGAVVSFKYKSKTYLNKCTYSGESLNLLASQTITKQASKTSGENHHLFQIITNDAVLTINYESENRLDYSYENAIDNIEIRNNHGNLIQKYDLVHEYFISDTPSKTYYYCDSPIDSSEIMRRLKLKSVDVYDSTNELVYDYSLEYNEEVLLPHRLSYSQDYWGYYNGKSNSNLIPDTYYQEGIYTFFRGGADRRVDSIYNKANILKKIQYPEGGITEFTYENNRIPLEYSYIGSDNIFEPTIELETKLSSANTTPTLQNDGTYRMSKNFTVGERIEFNNIVRLTSYSTICDNTENSDNNYDSGNLPISGCAIWIKIYSKLDPSTPVESIPMGYDVNRFLEPGDYNMVVEIDVNRIDFNNETIEVVLNWDERIYDYKTIGGLRVKEINTYENNSTMIPTYKRSFKYEFESGMNSGDCWSVPVFKYEKFHHVSGENNTPYRIHAVSSFSAMPLINSSQNSLGYASVIETRETSEENLVSQYKFSFQDIESSFTGAPTYYEWKSGNLKETNHYIKKNNSVISNSLLNNYSLLNTSKISYRYDFLESDDHQIIEGVDIYRKIIEPDNKSYTAYSSRCGAGPNTSNDCNPVIALDNHGNLYTIINGVRLKNKEENILNNYDANDNVSGTIIEKTVFEYGDLFKNQNVKSFTKYMSDNVISTTNLLYATDVIDNSSLGYDNLTVDELAAITSLNESNRISEPLQSETKIINSRENIVAKTAQRTIYSKFENDLILPSTIQTSKGNQKLEDRIVFHSYDTKGNPVEVSKKDGSKIYYVWGYNGTQPIAKIEGYTTISSSQLSAINSAISASNFDIDAASEDYLRSSLASLREAFPSALVTSFTYNPLIGVTSITDPRGEVIFYEYDEFNRLKFVKNTQKETLKEHSYHYKN